MWSQIVLCLCVGLAYATTNPGWRDNSEYLYQVRGRTLTGLHDISDQFSGILYKTDLKIQSRPDGNLQAKIFNAQYSQIQTALSGGWLSFIPDSEISWKPLALSPEPFQIRMENGVIKGITVNKGISNWEVNMIKGIVSQFQMKLTERPVSSDEFVTPFKVMEDTITGSTTTSYKVTRMPELMVTEEPFIEKLMNEKRPDEEIFEVTKHKNYTDSVELPSYFYGFAELEQGFPATNRMGTFLTRGSFSRAILIGKLNRYSIQNAFTISEILVNPTLTDKERGSVYSMVNVTLVKTHPNQGEKIHDLSNPLYLDNLVYAYGKPFDHSNEVRERISFDKHQMSKFDTAKNMIQRLRRSLEDTDVLPGSEESYKQDNPELHEAPESPLLRFTEGYLGQSIKQKVDVVTKVKELAKSISNEIKDTHREQDDSLGKFTILTSLIRIMNSNEIKNAADQLYTEFKRVGDESYAWEVYRDAVAESGTGPALLAIQDWIKSGRIEGVEASLVLVRMFKSVRQPSAQYMKASFELIKDHDVLSKWPLNDTAILGFSRLVRQVYVLRRESATQFPVKSFRNFRNEEGLELLKQTFIPYMTEQLHRAISQGETHKIHLYIRALGNFGTPQILGAFEPYLEGEKQASQLQRLLMVLAMDRLAEEYPEHALSVLMRLYQNSGETHEVRMASVYQIIRTKPSTEVLQYMASYTNIDRHDHVAAAVKSSIETISQLEGKEFETLRRSAEAAKPLLTKRIFGVQYGGNFLHQHVIEDLKSQYKDALQIIGSEDEYFPKGMKFSFHYNSAGLKKKMMNFQAIVSSVEELIHLFKRQTKNYSDKLQEQRDKHQRQLGYAWSSQKIAELLGIKSDEREQLEGSLYLENSALEAFLSFDNRTVHRLIKELTKMETTMESGKQIRFLKMSNAEEMAVAFPTETGLPFLYTYDTPSLIKVQGRVKTSASPKMFQEKLQVPDSVHIEADLTMSWRSSSEGRISFITPFDYQQYLSGYKKESHITIPLKGRLNLDTKKMQIRAEFEMEKSHKPTVLYRRSSLPFVSRLDILKTELTDIRTNSNTHVIKQTMLHSIDRKFGEKETGLALRVKIDHEKSLLDVSRMKHLFINDGPMAALIGLGKDVSIQRSEMIVTTLPEESSTRKVVFTFGYESQYKMNTDKTSEDDQQTLKESWTEPQQDRWQSALPEERKRDALGKISEGISFSKSEALDVSVEFQGEKTVKYTMTGVYSKSNVDPRSRIMLKYRRESEKPYMLALRALNFIENTNALDVEHSMQSEPQMKSKIEMIFGSATEEPTKIFTEVQFSRSEERKRFLEEQPMYKQCRSEMKDGDYQLPACANITMASNLLDRVQARVKYEDVPMELKEYLRTLYYVAQYRYLPTFDREPRSDKENEVMFQAKFDPDLRSVNVSMATEQGRYKIENVPVHEYAKELLVVHPVFHVQARVMAKAYGLQTYRPICVVDQTKISTFNNMTYPADVSDKWTVMFQYIPKEPRFEERRGSVQEQLREQTENYVVLVKRENDKKDVKITVNTPETKFEVTDVTMTPREQQGSQDARAKITVNNKEIQIDDKESYDFGNGYIQIYTLPNGEVKVEVRDQFYVIYDGKRIRLTVMNGKFRDSTRGICGQFNDEKIEDFLTPDNCFVNDHKKFIKSYEVEGSEGQELRRELNSDKEYNCIRKTYPLYVDVITTANKQAWSKSTLKQCTAFQTKYVHENGNVCFTLRPMPTCVKGCRPTSHVEKTVPVHCIQKSSVAQLWKNQIDNGGSPDFSQKTESQRVSIQIPQSCA